MGVALLAPVPSLHLKSAVETCAEHGKVAFGSMKADVFETVERDFGFGIPVYIYASTHHGPPYDYAASGQGFFAGHPVQCRAGHRPGQAPEPDLSAAQHLRRREEGA